MPVFQKYHCATYLSLQYFVIGFFPPKELDSRGLGREVGCHVSGIKEDEVGIP